VETVVSSSQSLTSSIGIGEFGMNAACRGNAAAFSMAVKDSLFPRMKFLQGTNASLDFSMEITSICGYLRVCCGVSDADASQWWDDHRMMLKNIHTDCRNKKIKMIKQQFNGKTRYSQLVICQTPCILLTLLLLKAWIKDNMTDEATDTMQCALTFKHKDKDKYIQFLCRFGPALTGMTLWNNNKTTKPLSYYRQSFHSPLHYQL
jgi:hypothetical protein